VRAQLFDVILQGAWEHVVEASASGGFKDPRTHISWTTLDLDEEAYDEVARLLVSTLERVLELKAESDARLLDADPTAREQRRTELTIFHFDRPEDSNASGAPKGGHAAASV
jgi:hypothetical protein